MLLGTLTDPAVDESSGVVASRRNPGLYWTHNDSGDGPVVYCMQPAGASCGAWRVTGAEARDWEDIAAGPGPQPGTSYLYAGDIGDNLEDLDHIVVYRFPEPAVSRNGDSSGATEPADALRLRYPDGSHNAEALLVHPSTGDLYIVVKEANPGVYVARGVAATRAGSTVTMERVASLALGNNSRTQVTGGDIAPDGTRLALSTYTEGYELRLPAGAADFDAIWQQPPQAITLGPRPQGESIAYRLDGSALLTTSERPGGLPGPIHQIERQ